MQFRTALLAIVASSALSTAAFAAVGNPNATNHPSSRAEFSDRCNALESQYDSIIGSKQNAPKLTVAEGLHARGIDQCNNNESDLGMLNLDRALHDLGVKPAA